MQKFERADFKVEEYVESENYGKLSCLRWREDSVQPSVTRSAESCYPPSPVQLYSPSRLMVCTMSSHQFRVSEKTSP